MNPVGISYFYAATTRKTALAEIFRGPPASVAIGTFRPRSGLLVLDVSSLPSVPSPFDENSREQRDAILFLQEFAKTISRPVEKTGREHIDYVPSQIVSEYFAKVFSFKEVKANSDIDLPHEGASTRARRINGLIYRSAVRDDGENIVFFPPSSHEKFESVLSLVDAQVLQFPTWSSFLSEMCD